MNTDFIYSALAQELGLIGAAGVLLVYMVFVLRGFRTSVLAQDGFSKLLAAGLTFAFALQTFIIVGGLLRVIPLTGITLPFVSYGGSSVVANFVLLAGPPARLQPGQRSQMNKQITRLSIVALVLLAALVVATTYWQTWAVAGLADRQDNAIRRVAQFKVRRGLVYSADGKLLAAAASRSRRAGRRSTSAATRAGRSPRRWSATRPSRARRPGSSARTNDYLTASNSHLSTVLRRTLDSLKAETVTGNNLG